MGKKLKLVALAAVATAAAAAAVATSATGGSRQGGTFVFASSADPVLLDPALVSDGESLRITDQIFESLVGFQLGGTKVVPELATSWKASRNGLAWTFKLRRNVKFSDGTPFNAAAVCFNYNRWYDFPAPLQNSSVSYYWNTVFGGFAHPAKGNPGPSKSLYRGCRTHGDFEVTILLRRRSSAFISAIGLPNFGIASPTALEQYKADAGTVDSTGVFHPTGTFATRNPVGTGPFVLKSWTPGSKLELAPNPDYWGRKPLVERAIYRPIANNAARLQALQSGEVDAIDYVDPADFKTVQSNRNLTLLKRPVSAVGYVGINQAIKPFDDIRVRQALAYALDRASVVKAFYGGQGQVANQFLPPTLVGFAKSGVPSYPYNPAKAKQLLQQAGLTLPVKVDFWYPTDVSRPYMPDPKRNFEAFTASLEKSGFQVVPHSAPWRPDYLAGAQAGKYALYFLGWIADYFDPQDFLNVHFGAFNTQFGFRNPKLFAELARADAETNLEARAALYRKASVDVMKFLPVVPYVWASGGTLALSKKVTGYHAGPLGPVNEPWALVRVK